MTSQEHAAQPLLAQFWRGFLELSAIGWRRLSFICLDLFSLGTWNLAPLNHRPFWTKSRKHLWAEWRNWHPPALWRGSVLCLLFFLRYIRCFFVHTYVLCGCCFPWCWYLCLGTSVRFLLEPPERGRPCHGGGGRKGDSRPSYPGLSLFESVLC